VREEDLKVQTVIQNPDGALLTFMATDEFGYVCVSAEDGDPSAVELTPADMINLGSTLLNLGRRMQEEKDV
jgi:hypothetical protein